MLELVLGRNRKQNTDLLLSGLGKAVSERKERQILIVPEQYSHEAERMLCERCGDSVSLYAEVLTFTRMADRAASVCGGIARECLDDGGRFTALLYALEQIGSRLKIYGTARTKPELVMELSEQIREFKNCMISAEDIRNAADAFEGFFAEKLSELSLIMESYDAVCKSGKADPSDKLLRLSDQLLDTEFADGAVFYLDGFSDFTGLQERVIDSLLQRNCEIHVTFVCDGLLSGEQVFSPARECAAGLLRTAKKYGVPAYVTVQRTESDCGADFLRENLFSSGGAASQEEDYLRLVHASSAEEECVHTAEQIRKLLISGCRCREIAVACTEPKLYLPILKQMLSRYRIPAYFTAKDGILLEPTLQAILGALRCVVYGFEAEDLFEFLHSALGILPRDACDRLENYVRIWNISGQQWMQEWTLSPSGYEIHDPEADAVLLRALNRSRETVIAPFSELKTALDRARNTAEQVRAFYRFLEAIDAEASIRRLAELHRLTDQRAQELGQIYDIVIGVMDQLTLVLGETVRSAEDFYRLFYELAGQYSLTSIPASLDSVTVGDILSLRYLQKRAVFILGADDGKFPSFSAGRGILTDQERELLKNSLSMNLIVDRTDRMDRELAAAYDVLCSAESFLSMSHSGSSPSFLFRRLSAMYPESCRREAEKNCLPDEKAIGAALAAKRRQDPEMTSENEAVLLAAETITEKAAYRAGTLEENAVQTLYSDRLRLSASKIDTFFSCAFSYFLQYGLHAKPIREAKMDAPTFGTFVHDVLEHTVQTVQSEGGFRTVSDTRIREITENRIRIYIEEKLNGLTGMEPREIYLFRRTLDEVHDVVEDLSEEMKRSEFRPIAFELNFKQGQTLPPITVSASHGTADVVGAVDRVDLYDDGTNAYVRIVDYKTGKKEIDYADILNGIGMQMLIYLFALEEQGIRLCGKPVRPAGVLYFPARNVYDSVSGKPTEDELETIRRQRRSRSGILLDDDHVLNAMEACEGTPEYLPYKLLKNGSKSGDLATNEQLKLLRSWVHRKMKEMTDRIDTGDASVNPYYRGEDRNSCKFCDYASVCHSDTCGAEKRIRSKKTAKEFWKTLEGTENG